MSLFTDIILPFIVAMSLFTDAISPFIVVMSLFTAFMSVCISEICSWRIFSLEGCVGDVDGVDDGEVVGVDDAEAVGPNVGGVLGEDDGDALVGIDNGKVVGVDDGEVIGEDDGEVLGVGAQASHVLAQCTKRSLFRHRLAVCFAEAHLHHSLSMPLITQESSLSMQLARAVALRTEVDPCSTNRAASNTFIVY